MAEQQLGPHRGLSIGAAAGLTLLSRLPFLGPGYGADGDAWRVAWAARVLATTGAYESSRAPGYPVQEIVSAWLSRGGPLAMCGASAVMAAVAAALFTLILRHLGRRDPVLVALAVVATPALYVGSTQALDYAWALAFGLAGLLAAMSSRPALAGLGTGLALGCRLSSALWIVPLMIVLFERLPVESRKRSLAVFLLVTAGVGAIVFAPVVLTYGLGFLRHYGQGYPSPLIVIKNATVDLWGIPGTLALAAVGMLSLRPRRSPELTGEQRAVLRACGVGIALFLGLFLYLPHEAAYLIPAVPLVLLWLSLTLPRRALVATCVALLLSPWVLKVVDMQREQTLVKLGRYGISAAGPLPIAQARREAGVHYIDGVLAETSRLTQESVVEAGEWLPQIRVRLGGKEQGPVRFTHTLTERERAALRQAGVRLHRLRDVP